MYILVFKLLEALAMAMCIVSAVALVAGVAYIIAASRAAAREDTELGIDELYGDVPNVPGSEKSDLSE